MSTIRSFRVDRDDYSNTQVATIPRDELAPGEVRVRVDAFAFTANNITYAVAGDMLGYWQFFPTDADETGNWGIIPVWGFADVVESRCDEVPVGDRLYGYFPPAEEVLMLPTRVSSTSLTDGVAHRQSLPPLYNRYRRVTGESGSNRRFDDATMLLGPLHMTSFVLGHRLETRDFHGAEQVVIVSASSKTSLGLAFALRQMADAPEIIGLTSERNADFVTSTGLYDLVVTYDAVDKVPQRSTVVVDMAGNAQIADQLRADLGEALAYTLLVGITHWEETSGVTTRPDPAEQENFFAPSYIRDLVAQVGPEEFDRRSTAFLRDAATATFGWMTVDRRHGLEALEAVYPDVRDGTLPPSSGVVVQL
ncbi:DUF2855 family protein [Euzebya tangerina]|uniref:DUF2855 family protein n=1 Tax=Euzebya tangerina TaxID=591198 RepID=UPI000E31EEAD|nr:DUF2855 family protein [Euzebya tangerina]